MKKGRFSLILALIILVLGVAATTIGVISGLGILPSPLKEFALTLSSLVSVRGGEGGLWEAGVFLLVLSAVILVFRQRKPFSMFLAFYLFPFYLTLIPPTGSTIPFLFPPIFRKGLEALIQDFCLFFLLWKLFWPWCCYQL